MDSPLCQKLTTRSQWTRLISPSTRQVSTTARSSKMCFCIPRMCGPSSPHSKDTCVVLPLTLACLVLLQWEVLVKWSKVTQIRWSPRSTRLLSIWEVTIQHQPSLHWITPQLILRITQLLSSQERVNTRRPANMDRGSHRSMSWLKAKSIRLLARFRTTSTRHGKRKSF